MEQSPRKPAVEASPSSELKQKASVPCLLPAFEPLSSSPPLPRPPKRSARAAGLQDSPTSKYASSSWKTEQTKYPTPVPTSSTGIISSSPPQIASTRTRPRLQRTVSALSERIPLASVPTIELDASGEETLLGRSGRSSSYRLSSSKFISRVHVRAYYVASNPPEPAKVEVSCVGWNGIKVHCQGKSWDLSKDDSFTSESQDADIIVEVQDTRVILEWPKPPRRVTTPESENSPRGDRVTRRGASSSPLQRHGRLASPISPTAAGSASLSGLFGNSNTTDSGIVQIYEDPSSDIDERAPKAARQPTQSTQRLTQPLGENTEVPQCNSDNEFSENDEENDPVVHSFGPFGDNLLPRMASFTAGASPSNKNPRKASKLNDSSTLSKANIYHNELVNSITNHVINQLAFTRISSTPISVIWNNLPAEFKSKDPRTMGNESLSIATLKHLIDSTPCLGEVPRQGKDAAGKLLESEYYYVPEGDDDKARREAVVTSLRKPGLRNCRKQHKQYFWRKPK